MNYQPFPSFVIFGTNSDFQNLEHIWVGKMSFPKFLKLPPLPPPQPLQNMRSGVEAVKGCNAVCGAIAMRWVDCVLDWYANLFWYILLFCYADLFLCFGLLCRFVFCVLWYILCCGLICRFILIHFWYILIHCDTFYADLFWYISIAGSLWDTWIWRSR